MLYLDVKRKNRDRMSRSEFGINSTSSSYSLINKSFINSYIESFFSPFSFSVFPSIQLLVITNLNVHSTNGLVKERDYELYLYIVGIKKIKYRIVF